MTREIAWPAKGAGDLAANSRLQPTPATLRGSSNAPRWFETFYFSAVRLGPTYVAVKPPTSAMNHASSIDRIASAGPTNSGAAYRIGEDQVSVFAAVRDFDAANVRIGSKVAVSVVGDISPLLLHYWPRLVMSYREASQCFIFLVPPDIPGY